MPINGNKNQNYGKIEYVQTHRSLKYSAPNL